MRKTNPKGAVTLPVALSLSAPRGLVSHTVWGPWQSKRIGWRSAPLLSAPRQP